MTSPNQYPHNYNGYPGYDSGAHERKRKWLKRAIGIGSGALAAISFGIAFQQFNGQNAEAMPEPKTNTSTEYDGTLDDSSTDTEQPEQADGELANSPEVEYPQPTLETARIDTTTLESMEDAPTAFAEKLSEWLMAGSTEDMYHEYLAFSGTIEEFTMQKAEENAIVYQDALFGGENIANQEFVHQMTRENAISLARFLTSVNNEWKPEITEAYHAKFIVMDDSIDEASGKTKGNWTFQLETNGDVAIADDMGYMEPLGGNGAMIEIATDIWVVDDQGEAVYGSEQFGKDIEGEEGQARFMRFDRVNMASPNPNT